MQVSNFRRPLLKPPSTSHHESIHSGHFMVSDFEAEAQDDEFEVAVPVPETNLGDDSQADGEMHMDNVPGEARGGGIRSPPNAGLTIETSLTKLFRCMTLAYRQKLTSPKWNRFKGIRLRWKDKIRLNNVIWRCWHMQFIKRENTLICQFASPLDEGIHNKPEAVVLEGKYWKRKLAAVTAEYKRWRMFYRNKIMGWACKDNTWMEMETEWNNQAGGTDNFSQMMIDEDYMDLMSDTLFSTISSNQPFAFPDIREIARNASLADFIQPSLVQLQPNLEDFGVNFEPLQEFFSSRLPPVPEDCAVSDITYSTAQNPQSVPVPPPLPPPPPCPDSQAFSYSEQGTKSTYYRAHEPNIVEAAASSQNFTNSGRQLAQLPSPSTYRYPMPRNIASVPQPTASTNYSSAVQNFDLAQTCLTSEPSTSNKPFERSSSLPCVVREDGFAIPKVVG